MVDRLEVLGTVNGTTTTIVINAEKLTSVQIWDGGRFQARMVGGIHDGNPVTSVQMRQAEVVFAYMRHRDARE